MLDAKPLRLGVSYGGDLNVLALENASSTHVFRP